MNNSQPNYVSQPVVSSATTEKKSNKAIIALLSVAAICGVGFGIYGMMRGSAKCVDSNAVQEEKSEEKTTELIGLKEAYTLLKKYVVTEMNSSGDEYLNIFTDKKISDKYRFFLTAYRYIEEKGIKTTETDSGVVTDLEYEKLNDYYHTLFGFDTDLVDQYEYGPCGVPYHDKNSDKYINGYCGGSSAILINYYITDYYLSGETLVIDARYVTDDAYSPVHDEINMEFIFKKGDNGYYLSNAQLMQ